MKLSFIRYTLFVGALLLLGSCAQVVAPVGGPKDVDAAVVLSMEPPHQSTQFQSKKIRIRFNEYIKLNNPSSQIVVSPPLQEKPEFNINGKYLDIDFRESLRPNTTYTINFGNAVEDIREANVTSNLFYSFSTGSFLDSAYVDVFTYNAFNNTVEKEVLVGLYLADSLSDSAIYNQKPNYFGVTKADGNVRLQNLPQQTFKLVAFKDENKNLKYDKNEWIAFHTDSIHFTDSSNKRCNVALYQPVYYKPNQLVDTLSRVSGRFAFVFYKPYEIKINHNVAGELPTLRKKGDKNLDTVFAYLTDTSLKPEFTVITPDTSFSVRLKRAAGKPFPAFTVELPKRVELNDSIHILLKSPCTSFDTSMMVLKEDTVTLKYMVSINSSKSVITIHYPWKEGKKYSLEVKDSAIYDVFKQTYKKQQLQWTAKTIRDYSTLILTFKNVPKGEQYIIQLLNEAETETVKELYVTQEQETLFEYMLPATLKLKVIQDKNKNGAWDTGNIRDWKQPESVYYQKDKLVLRAFWDLEQVIDLGALFK